MTSPILTGAFTTTGLISSRISKIFPFGITSFVFTDTAARFPPSTLTIDVTTRVGFVTSSLAYLSPRGQVLPFTSVTSPFSIVTVIWHPRGHPIHVKSLFSMILLLLNLYSDGLKTFICFEIFLL